MLSHLTDEYTKAEKRLPCLRTDLHSYGMNIPGFKPTCTLKNLNSQPLVIKFDEGEEAMGMKIVVSWELLFC